MTRPTDPSQVPAATVAAILDHAAAAPPLLGGARLVCIDGRAGSGKTTLASALAPAARSRGLATRLLHTDDVLEGWGGLRSLAPRLRDHLVGPLASGHVARIPRWDWHASAFTSSYVVEPAASGSLDLLVLEGVGSANAQVRSRCATAVWVEAPEAVRMARGLARDGEAMRDYWEQWQVDELRYAANASRCDLLVDGDGNLQTR